MKHPCDGPAPVIGDGFNKSATIATLLAVGLASKRAKVGIAVAKPVASKRAKSLRVDAVLEKGCEQSEQSP